MPPKRPMSSYFAFRDDEQRTDVTSVAIIKNGKLIILTMYKYTYINIWYINIYYKDLLLQELMMDL